MRHHNVNRKFGLKTGPRKALMRSLALSLVTREKIQTTEAKAKELRPFVEKLITRSMADTVANRRFLITQLGPQGAKKLIATIGPKFKDRKGGYTRVIKLPARMSDGSKMAQIEFV
ncbi:50S ribosomal protein L17 [Candidatus Parcubacteria bacterium]|nr:50S ribosomal protein L17 [Candidatus Parcubacteria bacterium]